jgi:acylphosphatase
MAVVRRRVLVAGRVQGVWFRDSCQRMARELGLTGSARNLEDGRLEIVAEGEPEAVDKLTAWAWVGPPRAQVTGVEIYEEAPTNQTGGFRIY